MLRFARSLLCCQKLASLPVEFDTAKRNQQDCAKERKIIPSSLLRRAGCGDQVGRTNYLRTQPAVHFGQHSRQDEMDGDLCGCPETFRNDSPKERERSFLRRPRRIEHLRVDNRGAAWATDRLDFIT